MFPKVRFFDVAILLFDITWTTYSLEVCSCNELLPEHRRNDVMSSPALKYFPRFWVDCLQFSQSIHTPNFLNRLLSTWLLLLANEIKSRFYEIQITIICSRAILVIMTLECPVKRERRTQRLIRVCTVRLNCRKLRVKKKKKKNRFKSPFRTIFPAYT